MGSNCIYFEEICRVEVHNIREGFLGSSTFTAALETLHSRRGCFGSYRSWVIGVADVLGVSVWYIGAVDLDDTAHSIQDRTLIRNRLGGFWSVLTLHFPTAYMPLIQWVTAADQGGTELANFERVHLGVRGFWRAEAFRTRWRYEMDQGRIRQSFWEYIGCNQDLGDSGAAGNIAAAFLWKHISWSLRYRKSPGQFERVFLV